MDMFSYLLGKKAGSGGSGGITIDSGSNEYGNYMKFSNGDVIQYGELVVESGSTYADLYFPVAFIDGDYLIMANNLCAGAAYGGSASIQTFVSPQKDPDSPTTLAYIYSWNKSGNTALNYNRKVSWIAIGKWK